MMNTHRQSAVEFSANSRVHVALDSSDVPASIDFYRILFGQEPTKLRAGYAKFEVADPALNLALNAAPKGAPAKAGSAHYGVQVKSTDRVAAMTKRFEDAGLSTKVEDGVACCYAVQDKVWVHDPDGNRWEVFVVLDNDAERYAPVEAETDQEACCAPGGTCGESAAPVGELESSG